MQPLVNKFLEFIDVMQTSRLTSDQLLKAFCEAKELAEPMRYKLIKALTEKGIL